MSSSNPSKNIAEAVSAAEEFEQKHYETNSAGEAQELDAGDFTRAAKQAGDSISSAAQSVKEAVVGPSDTKETAGAVRPEAGGAADAAQSKAVAHSPAELSRSLFGTVMDKIMPVAQAEGPRSAGAKWSDAKEEARESGREAKESARDAASAAGDQAHYGYERAADKTQGFLNRAGGAAVGAAEEVADVTRDAKDRVKRDWPDNAVRGVVQETEDLTRSAKERVQRDWQDTKRGTQRMLDESSAARQWEADHAPVKEEARGFFGSISHALFGSADKAGDKAQEAADRTRANARSAADTVSDKAQNAKEEARGFFNKAGDEADRTARRAEDKTRGFFDRAGDEADRKAREAEHKTRGFFNRASDDAQRTADRAEGETRGFFNSVSDEAHRLSDKASRKVNRLGDRISDTADDAENAVRNKLDRAEDYLTADLRPATSFDAALQNGQIPSNTQDVLASRYGRGRY